MISTGVLSNLYVYHRAPDRHIRGVAKHIITYKYHLIYNTAIFAESYCSIMGSSPLLLSGKSSEALSNLI